MGNNDQGAAVVERESGIDSFYYGRCTWVTIKDRGVAHLKGEKLDRSLCNIKKPADAWIPAAKTARCCKACSDIYDSLLPLQKDVQLFETDEWCVIRYGHISCVGRQGTHLIIKFGIVRYDLEFGWLYTSDGPVYRYPGKAGYMARLADNPNLFVDDGLRGAWTYYERWDGERWVHNPIKRVDRSKSKQQQRLFRRIRKVSTPNA